MDSNQTTTIITKKQVGFYKILPFFILNLLLSCNFLRYDRNPKPIEQPLSSSLVNPSEYYA